MVRRGIRRKIGAALAAVVACVAVVALWRWTSPESGAPAQPPLVSRAFRLQPGDARVYSLRLETVQSTGGVTQSVQSQLEADLDLQMEVREASAEERIVAFSVTNVRKFRLMLLGTEVGGDAAAVRTQLEGHRALAAMEPGGAIRRVRYPDGVPPLFQALLQTALAEVQVVLGAGPAWTAVEDSPGARVAFAYRTEGTEGAVERISKQATGLEQLRAYRGATPSSQGVEAKAKIALHREGYVEHATGLRHLWARGVDGPLLDERASFELRYQPGVAIAQGGAVEPGTQPALTLAEAAPLRETEAEKLEKRTAGLTPEMLVQGVRTYALTGPGAEHNEWLWRSVALVQQQPELVPRLEALFADSELPPGGRALVLDLLASVGNASAQAALRTLLGSKAAEELGGLGVARVALVTRPDSETTRWIRDHWSNATGPERLASAMVVGAVARNLMRGGAASESSALVEELTLALQGARTSEEKQALLRALGNASAASAVPSMLAYAADPDPATRAACATALRNLQSAQTEATLLLLARDPSATVQREAFRTLAGYRLEDRHLQSLREAVVAGRVGPGVLEELLNLASAHSRLSGIRGLLEAVLAQPAPSAVRARALEMLRTLRP